jgi:hypothetical protein
LNFISERPEEPDVILVLDRVEDDDVRVIEAGDRACLALEAGKPIRM